MNRPQGLAEGDEAVAGLDPAGQQLGDARVAVEPVERLADQAAQRRLPESCRRRVHRSEMVGGRNLGVLVQEPVFRVRHFEAVRP